MAYEFEREEFKPKVKLRRVRKVECGGCLTKSTDDTMWVYYAFKTVESVWLCPKCVPTFAADLTYKQSKGI